MERRERGISRTRTTKEKRRKNKRRKTEENSDTRKGNAGIDVWNGKVEVDRRQDKDKERKIKENKRKEKRRERKKARFQTKRRGVKLYCNEKNNKCRDKIN